MTSRYCKFYLVGCWYFWAPVTILELCPGMWLSHLGTVLSLHIVLDWPRATLSLELFIFFHWGKTLLCTKPNVLQTVGFSSLAGRRGYYSLHCVSIWHCCLGISFPASGGFPTGKCKSVLSWWRGHCRSRTSSLCAALSFLVLFPVSSSHRSLLHLSFTSSPHRVHCWLVSPLPALWPGNSPRW